MRRKRARPSRPSSRCRIARACRSKSSSLVSSRGIIAPPPDTRIPGSGRAREARRGIARRGEAVRRRLSGTRRLGLALRSPDAKRQTCRTQAPEGVWRARPRVIVGPRLHSRRQAVRQRRSVALLWIPADLYLKCGAAHPSYLSCKYQTKNAFNRFGFVANAGLALIVCQAVQTTGIQIQSQSQSFLPTAERWAPCTRPPFYAVRRSREAFQSRKMHLRQRKPATS